MERTGDAGTGKDLTRQHYTRTAPIAARSRATTAVLLLLAGILVLIRVPSLVQPMGADQGLYAYVGDRILHGERPYVHAWDQKPPAIHYTYAILRAVWPDDGVVAAADLAAAAGVAVTLYLIGRELGSPGLGWGAALLFLLLSNPAFTRLNGVRVRAQCETFIALFVTTAVFALVRRARSDRVNCFVAGLLLGAAFTYKYNTAVYVLAVAAAAFLARWVTWQRATAFVLGLCVIPAAFLVLLSTALMPLYEATIAYNVQYSGETYGGPLHFFSYLLTFPIARARDDALWTIGCAGCAVLLLSSRSGRERLIPVLWVATACLSIAINGSRGLPQYFVQAAPGLALAGAWGGWAIADALRRTLSPGLTRAALATLAVLVATGVWRVNQFPKLVEQTAFDAQHAFARISRDAYLARYDDERKYSAIGAAELGRFMREHSAQDSRVYVFGFTCAAYVYADRASASRFFWSRPVIAGFNAGTPGYGPAGVLADLERTAPAVVALQVHDWAPDVDDSAHFFMTNQPLADWLRSRYQPVPGPAGFDVWLKRD